MQIHGQAAWKLYLKDAPDAEERVVEDLAEVRAFMDMLMRPVIRPENVYAHNHRPGDVALWYNRALWHSVVSSLVIYVLYFKPRLTVSIIRPNSLIATDQESCINAMLLLVMIPHEIDCEGTFGRICECFTPFA